MRAGVFSGAALAADDELLARVTAAPPMAGANLSALGQYGGSLRRPRRRPGTLPCRRAGPRYQGEHAADAGAAEGIEVHVLPVASGLDAITDLAPDRVFLSNGPGDPATADAAVGLTHQCSGRLSAVRHLLRQPDPGPGLGRRDLQDAFGHRGINIPVIDVATGRCHHESEPWVSRWKAGPAREFDTDFGHARVSHVCANDGVVEGVELLDGRAFLGPATRRPRPATCRHLFDKFATAMKH